jgi:putative methionine-R-sulfoxide reductase with GAF domain
LPHLLSIAMMNSAIFNIGVNEDNSEYLNEKIRATNFLNVFYGILSLGFVAVTVKFLPGLTYLTVIFFAITVAALLFNYLALPGLARFLSCFGLLSVYSIYAALVTPDHQPLLAGFMCLQVLFLLPPWILFDLEERVPLILYCSLAILVTFLSPFLNNVFTYDAPTEVVELFRTGWLLYLCIFSAVASMTGALFFLEIATFQTGRRNAQLIGEMTKKAEEIAANEKKLNDYIAEIEAAKKEDEKRQWASNGIAKFSDILRTHHSDSQAMFDSIISNLVKYVGANQGGLFLIEGEKGDEHLKLMSMYAYDRKKYMTKQVGLGEGVLGQAVLEKSVVYLKQIPDNYVVITSGLGGAVPRSLVIVPLILNEEVYGVIELASFKEFEQHIRDFVLRIAESIASSVSSVRVTERTKTLLEELQQQTEEMKSQEEEMRQNMEELVATQEEMQRKEREYIQRIEELEKGHLTQSYN